MEQRIVFKILVLTFKSLIDLGPSYIRDLLQTYKPSSDTWIEVKILCYRAFSVCAPSLNLAYFKSNLKTYLSRRYFNLKFCCSIFRIYYLLSYCFKHFIVKRLRALKQGAI